MERPLGPLPLECGNLLPECQVLDDQFVAGTTDGPDGMDGEGGQEEEQASHRPQSAILPR